MKIQILTLIQCILEVYKYGTYVKKIYECFFITNNYFVQKKIAITMNWSLIIKVKPVPSKKNIFSIKSIIYQDYVLFKT